MPEPGVHVLRVWLAWPCAPLPSTPPGCLGASCPPWCGLEVTIDALWCGDVAWVHWDAYATGAAYISALNRQYAPAGPDFQALFP